MNTQPENPKALSQDEIVFLNKIVKEVEFKDFSDFMGYINELRRDEDEGSSNKIYGDLLENIVNFLLDTKNEYDEDANSCCPDPQEIDKAVDRVLLLLLKGLLKAGYAPDDSVIELMKEYIKRHES